MRYRKDGRLDLRFRGARARQSMLDAARLTAAQSESVRRLLERWRTPPVVRQPTVPADSVPRGTSAHRDAAASGGAARTESDRIALLKGCVTASMAWSVFAMAASLLMVAGAVLGTGHRSSPSAPEEPSRPGFLLFAAGCACWWGIRTKQSWDVRRAISKGELNSRLEGPKARSARLWMLLEGASTIVPGTCCIGPPVLLLTVVGNRATETEPHPIASSRTYRP